MRKRQRNTVHGFTPENLERLEYVIERSWDRVAADMFYNDQGERDESMTFSQEEVAEIALDADRWRDVCTPEEINNTQNLVKKFYKLEPDQQEEVLEETLIFRVYGY